MSKTKWVIDPVHSQVLFKVRHLMITTITGYFRKFTVEASTDDDNFLEASDIHFTADVNAIDTNNHQRDAHLRSADFFDSENFPEMTFAGKTIEGDIKHMVLKGDLTMHGITKSVDVHVEFGGIIKDMYGQIKAGFSIHGIVDRKDFGLQWGAVTETGNIIVSDEVKFQGEVQLIKQV
jgi:polyisoprenoid-binding protein YceI